MSTINFDLKTIKAFAFDVDGVLSSDLVTLHPNGEPMRTANIKDGYAMQLAIKQGFPIAIITGGNTEAVRLRYAQLGITDIYMRSAIKRVDFGHFLSKQALQPQEVLYMGDDIPDLEVLQLCGLPCCPADAVPEIAAICSYVSHCEGGKGCARDVIEQVLKVHGKWMVDDAFGW